MNRVAKEFAQVIACDVCSRNRYPKLLRDNSFNLPQPGYIGANYKNTGILFVGQNPGISQHYARDAEFAKSLIEVTQNIDAHSMAKVKNILDKMMPAWDISNKYFPLAECGIELNDIAYINVVRCRTEGNATPRVQITQTCISNHFVRWLDWLKPRVVVCLGKWAHDKIGHELEIRSIPNGFINRDRSLSSAERRENRQEAGALVRSVIGGKYK